MYDDCTILPAHAAIDHGWTFMQALYIIIIMIHPGR